MENPSVNTFQSEFPSLDPSAEAPTSKGYHLKRNFILEKQIPRYIV